MTRRKTKSWERRNGKERLCSGCHQWKPVWDFSGEERVCVECRQDSSERGSYAVSVRPLPEWRDAQPAAHKH